MAHFFCCMFWIFFGLLLTLATACFVCNSSANFLVSCGHAFAFTESLRRNHTVLCRIIACAPDKIKSIDGSKETLKLFVKITDLWFVGIPNKFEQAEMVIINSHVWFYLVFSLAHYYPFN